MAKQGQGLTTEQTHKGIATIMQRELGVALEENGAELEEHIENQITETGGALEKVKDDDNDLNTKTQDGEDYKETSDEMQAGDYGDADSAPRSRDDYDPGERRYRASNRSRDDEYYTPTVVNDVTLSEHLENQLGELELTDTQMLIARYIIGSLANNGWLTRKFSAIADDVTYNEGVEVSPSQVEEVLAIVQTLDPPGIGCDNLRECILLQLKRLPNDDNKRIATQMIEKHFIDYANRRFDSICHALNLSREQLDEVNHYILRHVNPKPGSSYAGDRSDSSQLVTPDFDVELDEGKIRLTLRNSNYRLQISETYTNQMNRYAQGKVVSVQAQKEMKVVSDNYERASRFIEVLRQRNETLFATMKAIVEFQRDYFLTGDETKLKPLVQRDVAEVIGKDVTVVSRAINNKYVQTPWGIRKLKDFFSEDINGDSRHEVQDALQQLIENEDKQHPLSDSRLCELLNKQGYKLERRTVAKYRDQLNIPNSTHRKQVMS